MATEAESGPAQAAPPGSRAVLNIPRWTLALGFFGAAAAFLLHRSDWAAGIVFGAILGWLDFRWLRRGASSMLTVSSGETPSPPRSAGLSALLALFRYVLIALMGYAIFKYLQVPLVSIVVGLCALGAATIAASVWEVLHPEK